MRSTRPFMPVLLALIVVLAGCGAAAPPAPTTDAPPATADTDTDAALRPVTVAFPYIPNVQFAPYYVAQSRGYYADAGLDVAFDYMFEDEAVQLLAQEQADFGYFSGISVLLARQNGIPVVTVAEVTESFPVAFVSRGNTTLESPDDLQGLRIGLPGRFGASYYGVLATLYAQGWEERALDLHDVGFNQVQVLLADRVDVIVGYDMNEPVQLRQMGETVHVLRVADIYPLVSDGIVTTETMIAEEPAVVRAFVEATLRGVNDLLADPDAAFDTSLTYIPEAELGDVGLQRAVFDATLPYWESERGGASDRAIWQQTATFLRESGLVTAEPAVDAAYTNDFVE